MIKDRTTPMLINFDDDHEMNQGQLTKRLVPRASIQDITWTARLRFSIRHRQEFSTKSSDIRAFGIIIYVRVVSELCSSYALS